jgi:hypothetical protein
MDWTIYKKLDEKRGEEIEEINKMKLKDKLERIK